MAARTDQHKVKPRDMSSIKRDVVPMPRSIRNLLETEGVWEAYQQRPPYQRNDYLAWITRAQTAQTRASRLEQMIDELKAGDVYMKMEWKPRGR